MSEGRSLLVLFLVVPLWSCSDAAVSKAVGTGRDGDTAIVVRTTDTSVVVENHTGRPLLAVRVSITGSGIAAPFVVVVPTIDTGASNEQALTGFRSDEGTPFDPATMHPTEVHVTARDMVAKSYDVTVPWKP
jgi:hypothetical protein